MPGQNIREASATIRREALPYVYPVAPPGAGSEWQTKVTSGTVWMVEVVRARFNSSSDAGDRSPRLQVRDDTYAILDLPAVSIQGANQQVTYNWVRNLSSSVVGGISSSYQLAPLPSIPLLGGWTISSTTESVSPDDHWDNITLYVVEITQRPYDVELEYDLARQLGQLSNAIPDVPERL